MNVLDLFSGIGGFSLGLDRAGFKTVAFCERDAYCQAVLRKHWPDVPCFDDVRTLNKRKLEEHGIGAIDLICGGYPCQPFSSAGERRGHQDDRHLWPEMSRLIRELRPTWVIGENVAGHITMGLDDVLSDLESQGYAVRTFVIPACAVGAPHRRDRTWIVAHSDGEWKQQPEGCEREERGRLSDGGKNVANASMRREQREQSGRRQTRRPRRTSWWPSEPRLGRVAYGVPSRMDRNKCLGNAVVPEIPEIIGRAIKESSMM